MPALYARLSDRHPYEVYMLVWTTLSVTPGAIGLTPLPPSLALAGEGVARVWAISLSVGAIIALIGLAWPRPHGVRRISVTGLILEQIGLVTVAAAMIFYSACAILRTGFTSIAVIGIILGLGVASAVQAWKIQKVLHRLDSIS